MPSTVKKTSANKTVKAKTGLHMKKTTGKKATKPKTPRMKKTTGKKTTKPKKSSAKKTTSKRSAMNLDSLSHISWVILDPASKAEKDIKGKDGKYTFVKLSAKEKNTVVFPTPRIVYIPIDRLGDAKEKGIKMHGTVFQVLQQIHAAYRPYKKAMRDLVFFEGIMKSPKNSKLYLLLGS